MKQTSEAWTFIGTDIAFDTSIPYEENVLLFQDSKGRVHKVANTAAGESELAAEMAHTRNIHSESLLVPYTMRSSSMSSLSTAKEGNNRYGELSSSFERSKIPYNTKKLILSYPGVDGVKPLCEQLEDEFLDSKHISQLAIEMIRRRSPADISNNKSMFFVAPDVEDADRALYRLMQLSTALCNLHEHRILHDDIRLGNVLTSGERLLLLVGGRVKNLSYVHLPKDDELHYYSELLPELSPGPYKAPERVLNLELKNYSHMFAGDVWSLGVLTYQMLCNRLPFGETRGQNATLFASLANKPQYVRKEFIWHQIDALNLSGHPIVGLLGAMLEFDPSLRPSAYQIATDLAFSQFDVLGSRPKPIRSPIDTVMAYNHDNATPFYAALSSLSVKEKEELVHMFYFKPGSFSPSVTSDIALFLYATHQSVGSRSRGKDSDEVLKVACFVFASELTQLTSDISYSKLLVGLLPSSEKRKVLSAKHELWSVLKGKSDIWFATPCMYLHVLGNIPPGEFELARKESHEVGELITTHNLSRSDFKGSKGVMIALWTVFQLAYATPASTKLCISSAVMLASKESSSRDPKRITRYLDVYNRLQRPDTNQPGIHRHYIIDAIKDLRNIAAIE